MASLSLLGPLELHLLLSPPPSASDGKQAFAKPISEPLKPLPTKTISQPPKQLTPNPSPPPRLLLPTTIDPCLEFFLNFTADQAHNIVPNFLKKAWYYDPVTDLKLMCNLEAARGTQNFQKEGFIAVAIWLYRNHPQTMACNLETFAKFGSFKYFPEILYRIVKTPGGKGRAKIKCNKNFKRSKGASKGWKKKVNMFRARRVIKLYYSNGRFCHLYNLVAEIFAEFLKSDINFLKSGETEKISLASKWCPSVNKLFDRRTLICEKVARRLFPRDSDTQYKDMEEAQLCL
ncbi:Plant/T31B5-30 protein [Quillaja saponaria]|uniref:Plant/T31B5-30 protein n=1 Tax=Quillaja saponaria TaxID=32244 RepID=A0AAD7VGW5_QUISA|nr:Plant/T31B5-30 protein [Quillaja saponaria]